MLNEMARLGRAHPCGAWLSRSSILDHKAVINWPNINLPCVVLHHTAIMHVSKPGVPSFWQLKVTNIETCTNSNIVHSEYPFLTCSTSRPYTTTYCDTICL